MFTSNPIKKRVLKVIEEKIDFAELEYQAKCEQIDKECKDKKSTLLDEMVNSLLNKFI